MEVTTMKTFVSGFMLAGLIALAGCSRTTTQPASAGPNGGDLVPIKGGSAYAELLANADTGEVLVNTWGKDLKSRRPIDKEPITVGSGDKSVELMPHPTDSDPSEKCSRFYGQAEWVRGGGIRHGWIHSESTGGHEDFEWRRCWQAGQRHDHMWEEMGKHRHMGPGNMPGGPGHGQHGGGMDR
jgi:hypothetical protein